MGGMVKFEFKRPYKLQLDVEQKEIGVLRIEFLRAQVYMKRDLFETLKENSLF